MDRKEIAEFGARLQAKRLDGETEILVAFGVHGPTGDTPDGHMIAVVRNAHDEARSEAVNLDDALLLARVKLKEMADKRKRDAEKAKGNKA